MNAFVAGFLDAPLLIDSVQGAFLRFVRRDRMVREMYAMSDLELRDMRLNRADIPQIIAESDADEIARIH